MIKWTLLIALLPLLYVGGMILFAWITKYIPEKEEFLTVNNNMGKVPNDTILECVIWNIGYGGLGAEADFFYDGGKMVRSPESKVKEYNEGITSFLETQSEVHFILIQEADQNSKRSWYTNQVDLISQKMKNFGWNFALNYDVKFVPVPYTEPMGKVLGGLLSLSRFPVKEAKRIQLPNADKFPDQLFYLERCLLLQRISLPNGKDLVVINTHFEAYDDGGVKKKQMAFTKEILDKEYALGNYVILGGDWNISPPGLDPHRFAKEPEKDYLKINVEDDYMKGWQFAYDSTVATNRKNKFAYNPLSTFTTVIDYFLISPNIEILETKGINLDFKSSDHQPVKVRFKIK